MYDVSLKSMCTSGYERDLEMDFVSHRVKRSDLVLGDHIYTWRTPALRIYSHHGQISLSLSLSPTFLALTIDFLLYLFLNFCVFFLMFSCGYWCKVVHFTQESNMSSSSSRLSCSNFPEGCCSEHRSGVIIGLLLEK